MSQTYLNRKVENARNLSEVYSREGFNNRVEIISLKTSVINGHIETYLITKVEEMCAAVVGKDNIAGKEHPRQRVSEPFQPSSMSTSEEESHSLSKGINVQGPPLCLSDRRCERC